MVFADILVTMTSALDCDVLVAGGGPAGLAIAIAARMNGLSAIVIERQPSPPDKACGECLMPAGSISAQPAGRAGFNRSRPSRFDRRHSIQTRRRCVGRGPTTITGRTGRQENRADCSDDASSAPTRRGNSPAHQRTRLSCPAGPCACRNGCWASARPIPCCRRWPSLAHALYGWIAGDLEPTAAIRDTPTFSCQAVVPLRRNSLHRRGRGICHSCRSLARGGRVPMGRRARSAAGRFDRQTF